eukprot:COSAG06_NODE_3579_length_5158_cov_66.302629_4_plen_50_part_00
MFTSRAFCVRVCVSSQVRVGGQYVVRVRGQGEGGWGAWSPRATVKIANP